MSDRGAGPRAVGRSLSPGRSQGGPHGPGPPRAPLSWAVALPRGLARSAHSLLPAPTSALIQVNVRCAPPRAGAARCCPGRRVWDPQARLSCGRGDPAPPRRAPPPRLLQQARDLRFPFSQVVGRDHARSHRRQAWTRDWQGPLTHTQLFPMSAPPPTPRGHGSHSEIWTSTRTPYTCESFPSSSSCAFPCFTQPRWQGQGNSPLSVFLDEFFFLKFSVVFFKGMGSHSWLHGPPS